MKNILLASVLGSLLAACGGGGSPPEFIDQTAQGEIDGVPWVIGDGFASVDSDGSMSIDLVLPQTETGCDIFVASGDEVIFSVPTADPALYQLEASLTGQTVTLFADATVNNFIATSGQIEIQTVTETTVTGRIAAEFDSSTYVNGNFEIPRCQ